MAIERKPVRGPHAEERRRTMLTREWAQYRFLNTQRAARWQRASLLDDEACARGVAPKDQGMQF